ncbi:MAG: hypothetical protein ACJAUK_001035 [Colwellia polaris]|jgi:hypothetical protein
MTKQTKKTSTHLVNVWIKNGKLEMTMFNMNNSSEQ